MTREETIRSELTTKFPFLAEKIVVKRERRLFADVPEDRFAEVLEHVVNAMGSPRLCSMSGVDEGENLVCVYHLAWPDGIILSLKRAVPRTRPVIRTVASIFPGGAIYEREVVDMLGIQVEGLPPGNRYPLPDNWPAGQYPLRKDWKPEMLDQASFSTGEMTHG